MKCVSVCVGGGGGVGTVASPFSSQNYHCLQDAKKVDVDLDITFVTSEPKLVCVVSRCIVLSKGARSPFAISELAVSLWIHDLHPSPMQNTSGRPVTHGFYVQASSSSPCYVLAGFWD